MNRLIGPIWHSAQSFLAHFLCCDWDIGCPCVILSCDHFASCRMDKAIGLFAEYFQAFGLSMTDFYDIGAFKNMKIEIVYCAVWHYTPRAISLMGELLNDFENQIESITLFPSDGGKFEVTVNGRLIYSKLKTGRHANPGEVTSLVVGKTYAWIFTTGKRVLARIQRNRLLIFLFSSHAPNSTTCFLWFCHSRR